MAEVGDPATGEPIGSTANNLKAAIAGETHEYTDMYPGMARTAREEGFDEIADWFETLQKPKEVMPKISKSIRHIIRIVYLVPYIIICTALNYNLINYKIREIMVLEGGLRKPERKAINISDPKFWNEIELDTIRRQFDVCHSCRRCFNLCDSFLNFLI